MQALDGLTVVEWATGAAGPYTGKLLAGFGAEVIKVEPPGGDPARFRPPFAGDIEDPERGLLFLYLNTGKRSLTLDVTQPEGLEVLDGLLRDAAVLIDDHQPAELEALGLSYDRWTERNPGLIVVSVTPFGQTGPRANDRAYGLNSYHAGGEGYTLAGGQTTTERPPAKAGNKVGDLDTGVSGLIATLAAIYDRELTGLGQHIDISAQDTGLALSRVIHGRYTYDGEVEHRLNKQRRPGTLIRCADGYVEIVIVTDETWAAICRVIGRPELGADERYNSRFARDQRTEEINALLEDWTARRTRAEVAQTFQENHVPGGSHNTLDEVAAMPQYAHREFFRELEHPVAGRGSYPTVPYRFSESPWEVAGAAPRLGADTEAILGRLGRSADDIARLRKRGILG